MFNRISEYAQYQLLQKTTGFNFTCATEKKFNYLEYFFSPWRMMTSKEIKHKESLLKSLIDLELDLLSEF